MSDQDPIATSVRQRLLNRATAKGEDYNLVLARYVAVRFLYRLSRSRYSDSFLLKGATMFLAWRGSMHRSTRDVDLLGLEARDAATIEAVVRQICDTQVEPDGIQFVSESVSASIIREDNPYGGIRATVRAQIGSARQQLQIDIGHGDAVNPVRVTLPTLLEGQQDVQMLGYPVETVISEKFEALVSLGMHNSRMKDFFDMAVILGSMAPEADSLTAAVHSTFSRRRTPLPTTMPIALTEAFWKDDMVKQRWLSFVRKNRVPPPLDDLEMVCKQIANVLAPALDLDR